MIEAIQFFNITDYEVIFRPDTVETSNIKTERLLQKENILYERISIGHILKDVFGMAFKRYSQYDRIFIGDYFDGGVVVYALSFFWGKRGAEVIYLDDGTGTLSIFDDYKLKRYINWRVSLLMGMYSIMRFAKRMPKEQFFTYFDIKSDKYKIYRNTFDSLTAKMKDVTQKGVYVIGTISSAFHFGTCSYYDYLEKLNVWIRTNYPGEIIYYCPHRRDKYTDKVLEKCEQLKFMVFDTQISVEYDFVNKEISPRCVVGFNSSALYSLNMMFPGSDIYTSVLKYAETSEYERALALAKDMNEVGIYTIDLDNE